MSYPRTTSAHRQFNGPPAHRSSQPPVRSRSNTVPYPAQSRLQNQQAQTSQNPEAAFIAQYRGIFSKRAAWIGVGIIAFLLLAVVPNRVGSKPIDVSSCEKKVKPTGEISRGQMSALLALPAGASKTAVRQVVDEPYCTLPAIAQSTSDENAEGNTAIAGAEREAYPLAFDPEAWVIVAYSQTGEYVGYDFVFTP